MKKRVLVAVPVLGALPVAILADAGCFNHGPAVRAPAHIRLDATGNTGSSWHPPQSGGPGYSNPTSKLFSGASWHNQGPTNSSPVYVTSTGTYSETASGAQYYTSPNGNTTCLNCSGSGNTGN
jgi:hypothetical protein